MTDEKSGFDLDVWGGAPTSPILVPPPGRAGNGCPCQVDGQCPPRCDACVAFMEEMARPQPTAASERGQSSLSNHPSSILE